MKRQTVSSVCFIFLFSLTLLAFGLAFCETGLRQVYGLAGAQEAVAVSYADGVFSVTVTGRVFDFQAESWRRLLMRLAEYLRR
jgi:hypothetical protein